MAGPIILQAKGRAGSRPQRESPETMRLTLAATPAAIAALVLAKPAAAAGVSGAGMSLAWGIPFAGLLLSIALMPLLAGHVWHHHYGKIAAGWSALLVIPFAVVFGASSPCCWRSMSPAGACC